MKTDKMKLFVKRLPNDGLYDLYEILIDEINSRKENSRGMKKFVELAEPVAATSPVGI